jgi:hypothetical protein
MCISAQLFKAKIQNKFLHDTSMSTLRCRNQHHPPSDHSTMRLIVTALAFCFSSLALCAPTALINVQDAGVEYERSTIDVPDLYSILPLEDVPTTFEEGIVLNRSNETRHVYQFGRPPEGLIKALNSPFGLVLKPLFGKVINDTTTFHHWGILISSEEPFNRTNITLQVGHMVRSPETGTVYELRNSDNTGLVYLDVKKWETYIYRASKVKFLGTLNRSDIELVNIGRAYIQHVGREGFNNFYRNCQIFTAWFEQALWPRPPLSTRADQLLGKFIWWFRDWKKTAKWGWGKVTNLLGISSHVEEVDSSADFVPVDELLEWYDGANGPDQGDNNAGH